MNEGMVENSGINSVLNKNVNLTYEVLLAKRDFAFEKLIEENKYA